MRKKIFLLFFSLISFPKFVFSFCPVCTVTVGVGIGLSRYLGVDDLISGIWIGGFLMSLVFWTIDWLNKKKIKFLFRKPLIFIFWYAITVLPLYNLGIIGYPGNKFFGIDKLLFGIISGSIVFLISGLVHKFLVKKNKGKSYFPFQKVVISVLFLIILSLIFYLII